MTVANRYKVLTISGAQCFAMLRALATRENYLETQILVAEANQESTEHQHYLATQLADLRSVRATFNNTPFSEGAKS